MRRYKNNPRQITKKAFTKLGETLDEFGDLSIIVHDLNSDQIVGGNQRSTVFGGLDVSKIEPVIMQRFDPPTRAGTVAIGYIVWNGEPFLYRAVRWDEEQCAVANIKANSGGAGQWDADLIAGWPVETLTKAGWDADLLKSWNADGAILATMLGVEQNEVTAPDDFKEFDEDIETEHCCPKCGYRWSGKIDLAVE